MRKRRGLSLNLIMPATVHTNSLDALNANELQAYVITAIALVGKRHELFASGGQITGLADDARKLFRRNRTVQAV